MVAKIEKSDLIVIVKQVSSSGPIKKKKVLSSGEIKETSYLKNNPMFFFIYKIAISK